MKIVFLGPPGAGKGTQAEDTCKTLGIAHISTGDILRANIKAKTELGKAAQSYIEKGDLVPDSVVIAMVQDRIKQDDCANGFLFDGFPRTIAQAEALDQIVKLDVAINLEVPTDVIVKRISGRRICRDCAKIYHISTCQGDKCEVCGGEVYQRPDDSAETVSKRLSVYDEQTQPLIDYYKASGILVNVDGNRSIEEVGRDILSTIEQAKK